MTLLQRASLALYGVLVWLAQPLLRRKLRRRARAEPGYGLAVPERFGFYTQPPAPAGHFVWLHAVSLGEARTAAILMQALREAEPGVRFVLTHGTATGREEGKRSLREGDLQVWQPWDTPAAVSRFLAHFQPRLGVLMETEVWPQTVQQCRRHGVPLWLVNARMSEKSLRAALRWPALMQPAFAGLSAVLAQTQADAQRLQALGAPVLGVTGNLKFDARPDAAQCALGQAWRARVGRPVAMLASSREGEEAMWLAALQRLPVEQTQALRWLVVPRHPQRVDEVQALLQGAGLRVRRRSEWGAQGPGAGLDGEVWLGDSLGEMALYYSLADMALLGGSFAMLGGQNLIEAAACACPVLMGPHTFNFLEAAEQAEQAGAAARVPDLAQAVEQALTLAQDMLQAGTRHAQMRQAALAFAQAHTGAARRTAAQMLEAGFRAAARR
jgi:3-deoxy-D-manno-octulosonic-acid transferase